MPARDSKGRFVAGVEVIVTDRATSWLRRITRNFDDINRAGKRASKAFELSANMKQAADNVAGFSRDVASVVQAPIKKFMDFQEVMSSVKASTFDLTEAMDAKQASAMNEAMADLNKTARDLGASTKFSATEVAQGMDILAKNFSGSDLEKAQAVAAAMPGILDAAAAAKESIETTSDISSAAMNQFGLKAKDMGRIGDVLVKTANASATGLVDLGEALKYSGVTAQKAGLDLETTVAMLGALGNAGKKGSQAGTGLSSVLGNIQSGMKKQKSALAWMGINIKDKQGNLRPVVELLAEIDRAADKKFGKGKGGVRRDRWMQALVGMGSDKEVLAILTQQAGSGELQKLIAANAKAQGSSKAVAAAMNDNAAGAAKNLDSAMEELQLTVGEKVIPEVTELLKWTNETVNSITAWSKENPELVKGIAAVAGGLALVGLVVAPVIKGVSTLVTIYGGLTYAWGLAKTAAIVLRGELALMRTGIMLVGNSIKMAFLANPVTATIMGIATAALLVYEYWEPLSSFFSGLWDSVSAGFTTAFAWIIDKISWARDQVGEITAALTGDVYVSERQAKEQQGKLAGMSEAELRTLRGTAFGSVADAALVQQRRSANDAAYTIEAAKRALAGWGGGGGSMTPQGAPLLQGGEQSAAGKFDGSLKISVDSDGKVTKTELKTRGEAPFRIRANTGRQAA